MKFSLFMAAFALLAAFPIGAKAMDKHMNHDSAPVKAVAFHSDSCGSCKILGPRMKEATKNVSPDKLEVVKFDFTNKQTIEATKKLAAEKKVGHILNEYGAKTGFVVLVDASGKEVDKIKVDDNVDAITKKLATAVANAS